MHQRKPTHERTVQSIAAGNQLPDPGAKKQITDPSGREQRWKRPSGLCLTFP